jgi:DNA replication initiation complex subunit (GINS family)
LNVDNLTEIAQREHLRTILENLIEEEPGLIESDVSFLLESFVDILDSMDDEDAFGTEGWKHRFGIE